MSNILENIKRSASEVVRTEVETVSKLIGIVDDNFAEIVSLLMETEGKVIVSGVGKSAFVARKLVATLNSTGTEAVFLHASDAIHGDMGVINERDIVVLISKSGDTPEMKRLLYFIRKKGNRTVSIVSERHSYMAESSDHCIFVPVEKEAGYRSLAPTSSTTAHLVVCDAIAMSLAEMKQITSEDFARCHPGGVLGKRLYMKVEDVFDRNNRPSVDEDEIIRNVIINISSHRLGATVVNDRTGRLVGIITDGDVRRMVERGDSLDSLRAKDIMSRHPKTIDILSLAADAFNMMKTNKITSVIVLDKGNYSGLIHIHDIIREGI